MEKIDIMVLGQKLKQARLNKNFSQEYLAQELNISQKTYSNFENNKTTPSFSQIEQISQILETSILDFLSSEKISFYNNDNKGGQNGFVVNTISDKLIEQYELRIKKQEEEISYFKNLVEKFLLTTKM